MIKVKSITSAILLNFAMCSAVGADLFGDDEEVATLYRNSVAIPDARFHIATFDAEDKKYDSTRFAYNFDNCKIAAELFKNQSGVKVDYWCEKGRFEK
tara:strand:+ start:66 stop:359 length:294 start_codon:yes stop_codon:yes gene_type:complete